MDHAYNVTFVSDSVVATVKIVTDVDNPNELSEMDEIRIERQARRVAALDGCDLCGAAMEEILHARL